MLSTSHLHDIMVIGADTGAVSFRKRKINA